MLSAKPDIAMFGVCRGKCLYRLVTGIELGIDGSNIAIALCCDDGLVDRYYLTPQGLIPLEESELDWPENLDQLLLPCPLYVECLHTRLSKETNQVTLEVYTDELRLCIAGTWHRQLITRLETYLLKGVGLFRLKMTGSTEEQQ